MLSEQDIERQETLPYFAGLPLVRDRLLTPDERASLRRPAGRPVNAPAGLRSTLFSARLRRPLPHQPKVIVASPRLWIQYLDGHCEVVSRARLTANRHLAPSADICKRYLDRRTGKRLIDASLYVVNALSGQNPHPRLSSTKRYVDPVVNTASPANSASVIQIATTVNWRMHILLRTSRRYHEGNSDH